MGLIRITAHLLSWYERHRFWAYSWQIFLFVRSIISPTIELFIGMTI